MFSHERFNGYYQQQHQINPLNMGNPYYPVPTQQNFPAPYPNPYFQQQPNMQGYYPMGNPQSIPYHNPYQSAYSGKNQIQSIFQNPLEPNEPYSSNMQMMNNYPINYNPYPKPNMVPKPNGGIGTIMNSFKGQDGNLDLNKMMNTAGQMMNAVNQVTSMVKGLGGIFKV
ncbi:YppG family protein [Neobacillus sp. D3-1R]|uniref:YppG family protein n=1 Tax=Neobacillus sp. D3-1R TaxID=3445778 RepID=UPI003FA18557